MSDAVLSTKDQIREMFAGLAAPFEENEIRTRNQGGRTLHYITASTVANRLDEVLGPDGWEFELKPWGDDALFGTLSIRLPDGTTLRKMNVGGCADMAEGDNDAKSAASDCLKRCGAMVGIGRYLYGCGVPRFVEDVLGINIADHMPRDNGGGYRGNGNGGGSSYQAAPPRQQHDDRAAGRAEVNRQFAPSNGNGGGGRYDPKDVPARGAALLSWALEKKDAGDRIPINAINAAQNERGFPKMLKEWNDDQIAEVRGQILGGAAPSAQSRPAQRRQPEPAAAGAMRRDYDGSDEGGDEDLPF